MCTYMYNFDLIILLCKQFFKVINVRLKSIKLDELKSDICWLLKIIICNTLYLQKNI